MRNTLRLLSIASILSTVAVAAHADTILVQQVGPLTLPAGSLVLGQATTTFNAPEVLMQSGVFTAPVGGSGTAAFSFTDVITITPNGGAGITHNVTVNGTETLGATPSLSFLASGPTAFGNLNLSIVPATFTGTGNVNIALTGSITNPAPPSAVPEPSSLVLLGTGVLGLAGAARRKFMNA